MNELYEIPILYTNSFVSSKAICIRKKFTQNLMKYQTFRDENQCIESQSFPMTKFVKFPVRFNIPKIVQQCASQESSQTFVSILSGLKDLHQFSNLVGKVENILKGSLDSIPSPSPSLKIQIMGGKVCLRCKGKTLLGVVNRLFVFKSLLISPSNVLPYYLK